ncbi:MAG: type IV toxin-antitoxin system AbiEi family antitoxin [Actinomycetota bacterium]|nr:type IV toxin-antitoxin system AbiEi family antitoxin [Actinomycetota bacterium]
MSAAPDKLDGYVAHTALSHLVQRYRLESDPAGSVILRETGMPASVVAELAGGRRHVLAGLDLAGSTDARERATGQRLLERAVEELRG